MKKIAIVATHPVQYNAPWFTLLNEQAGVQVKVFYTWGQLQDADKFDPGFSKKIEWDIPLLEGYDYTFVPNTSASPGSHHRKGIVNPTLIHEITGWQPQMIIVFGWNFESHFACMKHFHKKVPVVFRGDSTMLRKMPFIKTIARNIYLRYVYSYVDYALYVGKENKKYFEAVGLKASQLIFAPHAVDNNRFAKDEEEANRKSKEWRLSLGIGENETVVLFAGKFEQIKRPWLILELAESMKGKPVKFVLVGNGPLEEELKAKAGGNQQIIFIGFQNQSAMPVVYRLCDYFILCSESETWGLSVNEAMACGCAVLVSNTCGCAADLVQDGINGFVFNDIKQLAHKIPIERNSTQLAEMKQASKKIIHNYSFDKIVSAATSLALQNG